MMRKIVIVVLVAAGLFAPAGAWAQRRTTFEQIQETAKEQVRARTENQSANPSPRPAANQTQAQGRGQAAQNRERADQPPPSRPAEQVRVIPLQQVLSQIQRGTPGRHLDARQDNGPSGPVYFIVWSTNDGRRIDFVVDAQTGRVISRAGG